MSNEVSTLSKAGAAAIFTAAIFGAWSLASLHLPPYLLPSPMRVGEAGLQFFTSPQRLVHVYATLMHIGISIAIAFAGGALLALTAHYLAWSAPAIHMRLSPFLNAFSGIGWTLLAVIWFGVSTTAVIFSIATVLLPFALINLREGLLALDRELDEMGRSFGRARWRLFAMIVTPGLLPFAAATLRIMFGVAWKVTLTAELFGGSRGLGYLINLARQEYDTDLIFTVIIFIIVAVYLSDRFIFLPLERRTSLQFGGRAAR